MASNRLNSILAAIPPGTKIADIGSDHGYIPIELSRRGYPKPIATEVLIGPYQQCKQALDKARVDVELRFGHGLDPILPGEVDMVIIAGMSGQTIAQILCGAVSKISSYPNYLLQPMLGDASLRSYLYTQDLGITNEWVVQEATKFYRFLTIVPEKLGIPVQLYQAYATSEPQFLLDIGPHLLLQSDPVTHRYLLYRLQTLQTIKTELDRNKHKKHYETIENEINQWIKVIQCHTKLLDSNK